MERILYNTRSWRSFRGDGGGRGARGIRRKDSDGIVHGYIRNVCIPHQQDWVSWDQPANPSIQGIRAITELSILIQILIVLIMIHEQHQTFKTYFALSHQSRSVQGCSHGKISFWIFYLTNKHEIYNFSRKYSISASDWLEDEPVNHFYSVLIGW